MTSSTCLALAALSEGGAHGGASAPVELIVVSLLVLVLWAAYRITSKKRT